MPLTLHYDPNAITNAIAATSGGVEDGPQMVVYDGLLEIMENEDNDFVVCDGVRALFARETASRAHDRRGGVMPRL